jgi:hypothetical protein
MPRSAAIRALSYAEAVHFAVALFALCPSSYLAELTWDEANYVIKNTLLRPVMHLMPSTAEILALTE